MNRCSMLQFALARGIGEVSIKKAIAFIESNNLSWDDFIQDRNLLYHFGLKDNVITNISTTKSQAYALYEELELSGVKILSESDIAYPQYLKKMLQDKCPSILFVSGNIDLLNSIAVGFCGSRKASAKGIGIAADCSRQLTKENITVISGYNQKPDISKFTLYVAQGYSINEKAFTNDSEKEYQTIIESDKAVTALVSRVKQIYKDDLTKFKRDYQTICSKSTIERLGDIDELIAEQLITPFHATAADIGKTYFEKRIAELFTRICARIMDCAGQRSPYVCGHAEYMQLCEEICKDISPTQYTPDYEAFRQVFSQDDLTSEITNSREYRQLRYCKLSNSEILDHLSWEQYYQSIRQHYLADAKKDAISKTESIAHQNHKDVVYELQDENKDTPRLRLIKTKRCEISTLHDEFSRWGTYIFLTQNDLPNKISWKDEDEDANEQ